MKQKTKNKNIESQHWDLFRLSRAKEIVDLCPNTLRSYRKNGLNFYRRGKAVFVSKSELEEFIRTQSQLRTPQGGAL